MPSILIVDNEKSSRTRLSDFLKQHGYMTDSVANMSETLQKIKSDTYNLILANISSGGALRLSQSSEMSDRDGIDILKSIKQIDANIEVIVFAEYGTIKSAVEFMKLGAFDYMLKPVNPDELLIKVERAIAHRQMTQEIEHLREQFRKIYKIDMIIAESEEMREILHLAAKVAESDSPILIQGESGTGKELIAKAIHSIGRSWAQFIPVNCGALPETLLESELFGYMKGSFTGATINKKGLFEEAHKGTLFMDEIGDMSPITQVKLLRALDFGEIRRIGSNTPIYVDARLITATNKDMKSLVATNKFREDLYYRLNVISIVIPPLRERRADILPLAEHFLKYYSSKMEKEVLRLSPEVRQTLVRYDWPGNVRELENVIERAVVLAQHDTISLEDLPSAIQSRPNSILKRASIGQWNYKRLEREYILSVLAECYDNHSIAAKRLGIGRNTLWRKLK